MKQFTSPLLLRLTFVASACVAAFFLGKHLTYPSFPFSLYSLSSSPPPSHSVAVSANFNLSFDVAVLINQTLEAPPPQLPSPTPPQSLPPPPATSALPPPPPSPPPPPFRFGIVDENGAMRDDFETGLSDLDLESENSTASEAGVSVSVGEESSSVSLKRFLVCEEKFREYIPCLDNEEELKRLVSMEKGERFERHCPKEGKGLNCLVPVPKGYRSPIPWPRSRDEVCSSFVYLFYFL